VPCPAPQTVALFFFERFHFFTPNFFPQSPCVLPIRLACILLQGVGVLAHALRSPKFSSVPLNHRSLCLISLFYKGLFSRELSLTANALANPRVVLRLLLMEEKSFFWDVVASSLPGKLPDPPFFGLTLFPPEAFYVSPPFAHPPPVSASILSADEFPLKSERARRSQRLVLWSFSKSSPQRNRFRGDFFGSWLPISGKTSKFLLLLAEEIPPFRNPEAFLLPRGPLPQGGF